MSAGKRWPDYLIPLGIIACLMVIFLPLPTIAMDLLLAANLSVAFIILFSTIYVKSPLELSLFPSILLATTLGRLALNIATTRLILTNGASQGELAAGGVIENFANFVTGESLAVGLVIFSIIVVVQFVVITKGATRISEVTARFALDGLPGRQLAIDAELNAGTIDPLEAQRQRQEVAAHADFYGAMDGASKFVRGDAIAGVLITLINIVVGLAVGLSHQMSLTEAASVFTKLTIGDGLVSQVPALLVSLAAALLVTRSTRQTDLPKESLTQFFSKPVVLMMTAVFLCVLVFANLPPLPLLALAGGFLTIAYWLAQSETSRQPTTETTTPPAKPAAPAPEPGLEKLLTNDQFVVELGADLIQLANARNGGALLGSIGLVRQQLVKEMGLVLPKVSVRDELSLPRNHYRVLIHGDIVEAGEIHPQSLLAVDTGRATGPLESGVVLGIGSESVMPEPAYWINPDNRHNAERLGYAIRTPTEALTHQLKQLSLEHAAQLLTRDATQTLIDEAAKHSPAVVNELIPNQLTLVQVQKVLKNLVAEGVSIRPLSLILETLGDHCFATNNTWDLTERVRVRLGRHISAGLAGSSIDNHNRPIFAFTLSEELQDRIACGWNRDREEIQVDLPPQMMQSISAAIADTASKMAANGLPPIAMIDQSIRPVIAQTMRNSDSGLFVLGSQEVVNVPIEIVGEITRDQIANHELMVA